VSDPRKKQPLVLPNYPYLGKFSREQLAEALDRKDKIVETMLDPIGPDGTLLNIPIDMMHIVAFHQALAGVDVHTDHRRLIESRLRHDPDSMFELYEWRPVGEFDEEPAAPAGDGNAEAADLAEQMRRQLTPEVRQALASILADEFAAATADRNVDNHEHARNVLTEQREIRAKMKEANP